MSQTEDHYAAECAEWQRRAEQAEALVARLRDMLISTVRVGLRVSTQFRLSYQESEIEALLADPTGARAEPQDGPLLTCPWCGADQTGRIANAQISHLIECGDRERARLAEEKLALETAAINAARRTRHAMACEVSEKEDCSCGALSGERAALEELRQVVAAVERARGEGKK